MRGIGGPARTARFSRHAITRIRPGIPAAIHPHTQLGAGLLLLSALLWGWCAVLLLTDYTVETRSGRTAECEARLFTERGTANEGLWKGDYCQDERDWPEALLVLGLSVPVALVGTALFTTGQVSRMDERALPGDARAGPDRGRAGEAGEARRGLTVFRRVVPARLPDRVPAGRARPGIRSRPGRRAVNFPPCAVDRVARRRGSHV